tara:strand:- start:549 stop:1250 length:702 start_codon:yes stop_codon:yes gene_type:complete
MSELPATVILAGGLATRLDLLTTHIPKSLLDINGKPFIYYQIEYLAKQGIKRIILCVGHLGEQIKNSVGDGKKFGVEIIYSFEKNKLLGTGGAIKNAFKELDDTFYILYGDSWLEINYYNFFQSFLENNNAMLSVYKNVNKHDKSNIEIKDNLVINYSKQNKTANMLYIDYGLSIMTKKSFNEFENTKSFDLELVYKSLVNKNLLGCYEVYNRFYEIGSVEGYTETTNYLKGR